MVSPPPLTRYRAKLSLICLLQANTMKKKMVIKVVMNGNSKTRSKALRIAINICGVQSAALGETDKDQLVVVGEGVNAEELIASLRKKLAKWPCLTYILPKTKVQAELLNMKDVEEKK